LETTEDYLKAIYGSRKRKTMSLIQDLRIIDAAERMALEVIRHHHLNESYMRQELCYSWDEVHEDAERLEHWIA
jgi:Mn-dependent DtxR family transcriptional regulator